MFKAMALAAGVVLLGASGTLAQPIGIGTSPQGTLTYTLAATYAKVAQQLLGQQVRVCLVNIGSFCGPRKINTRTYLLRRVDNLYARQPKMLPDTAGPCAGTP